MKEVRTELAPLFDLPFSQAVEDDGRVYVSGQVGFDPETGAVVSDDVAEQAAQTLDNVEAILEAAGTSFDNVLKVTVYLDDTGDFGAVNEVYQEYVTEPFPARSAVGVDLADVFETELLVEIDVVAAL